MHDIVAAAAVLSSPAMAEEICGGSLEGVLLCEPGKPWESAPEPWQWLRPPFDRGDAANQLVGVMTDIVFKAQKCPAIKPNFALFGTMMLTLGVRQADIDAGKFNSPALVEARCTRRFDHDVPPCLVRLAR